eukprot:g2631.t1
MRVEASGVRCALAPLAALASLDLSGSGGLAVLKGLASLRHLRQVRVSGCFSLCFIERLDLLQARGVDLVGLPDTYPFRHTPAAAEAPRPGARAKRRLMGPDP